MFVWHRKNILAWGPWKYKQSFHPVTPMSDQDRISPYNINTITIKQVMRIKKYKFKDFLVDPVPNSQK